MHTKFVLKSSNLAMANNFNNFYMLLKWSNRNFIELKKLNLIDTTEVEKKEIIITNSLKIRIFLIFILKNIDASKSCSV